MSNKVSIEFNSDGIQALLKSDEILSICKECAEDIAANYSGEGTVTTTMASTRGYAEVSTDVETNELLISMGKAKEGRGK